MILGGIEHQDFSTIRFVVAHELGHVKCRHLSLWRQALAPVSTLLLFNKSLIRAQEYTADRVARPTTRRTVRPAWSCSYPARTSIAT